MTRIPTSPACPARSDRGFSLVELLVVVAVIALTAAVALPNIAGYMRLYTIRSAASAVKSEVEAARLKAVSLNADYGVLLVAVSTTQFRYVIEDKYPQPPQRPTLTALLAEPSQLGPLRSLPNGVEFATGCTIGGGPFTATDPGMRFNRLGMWCDPGSNTASCPALGAGHTIFSNAAGGTSICLRQPLTGLQRVVQVSTGGRVVILQ